MLGDGRLIKRRIHDGKGVVLEFQFLKELGFSFQVVLFGCISYFHESTTCICMKGFKCNVFIIFWNN